jgi:hypothetical protein
MAVVDRTPRPFKASIGDRAPSQGRSVRVPLVVEALPVEDRSIWLNAYEEALDRGAGFDVAKFFANQRLVVVREERDGIVSPGAGDYAAYR